MIPMNVIHVWPRTELKFTKPIQDQKFYILEKNMKNSKSDLAELEQNRLSVWTVVNTTVQIRRARAVSTRARALACFEYCRLGTIRARLEHVFPSFYVCLSNFRFLISHCGLKLLDLLRNHMFWASKLTKVWKISKCNRNQTNFIWKGTPNG